MHTHTEICWVCWHDENSVAVVPVRQVLEGSDGSEVGECRVKVGWLERTWQNLGNQQNTSVYCSGHRLQRSPCINQHSTCQKGRGKWSGDLIWKSPAQKSSQKRPERDDPWRTAIVSHIFLAHFPTAKIEFIILLGMCKKIQHFMCMANFLCVHNVRTYEYNHVLALCNWLMLNQYLLLVKWHRVVEPLYEAGEETGTVLICLLNRRGNPF